MVFPRAAAAGHYRGRASLLLQHPQAAAAGRGQQRQGATGGVPSPSPQGLKDAKQGSDGGLWGDTGGGGTGGERTGVRRRWVEEERRWGLVRSRRAERGQTGGAGVGREETERMGARKLKPHLGWGSRSCFRSDVFLGPWFLVPGWAAAAQVHGHARSRRRMRVRTCRTLGTK